MARTAASGQGIPAFKANQVSMPATMNKPGMLKLRKLSTPIASVNATATSAYTLPSTSPLTSCCSSMPCLAMGDVRHGLRRAVGQLVEKALGAAERAGADVPEEQIVDFPHLGNQRFD